MASRWRRSPTLCGTAALVGAAGCLASGGLLVVASTQGVAAMAGFVAPRPGAGGRAASGGRSSQQQPPARVWAGAAPALAPRGARGSGWSATANGRICSAAAALGLALRACHCATRPRASVCAGAAKPVDAALSSTPGGGFRGSWAAVAVTVAAAAVGAGFGARPALAAELFPLDLFNPWESFVNINANLILGIDSGVGSAGVAILLYTVFAKVITYPIYQASLRTSALMRIISPQVKQIQKQYQEDEALRNKMVQSLYQKVGVNPIDGLLPVFAQLPVFLALFYAIKKLALQDDHFKESFLWIPSLAGPVEAGSPSLDWLLKSKSADAFEPLVGWGDAGLYLVLPVVLLATQLLLAKVTSAPKDPDVVTLSFPFIVGFSTLVSPQGLGVYWLTNSLLTAAQTGYTRSQVNEEFPEFSKTFEASADLPDEFQKGDKVLLEGRAGVVSYGPDTDSDCKVRFEDGTESGYVKAFLLRRPGMLDDSISEMAVEVEKPTAPKTRRETRLVKEREKQRRRRQRARA